MDKDTKRIALKELFHLNNYPYFYFTNAAFSICSSTKIPAQSGILYHWGLSDISCRHHLTVYHQVLETDTLYLPHFLRGTKEPV